MTIQLKNLWEGRTRLQRWLITPLLVGLFGVLLVACQGETTPENSALVKVADPNHPEGSKVRIEYARVPVGTEIHLAKEMVQPTAQEISDAITADKVIQSMLLSVKDPSEPSPKKLSIRQVSSAMVGEEPLSATVAVLRTNARRPIPAKWLVRIDLQYENIPLSQGSDALAILGTNNKLYYLIKRNFPLEVDATKPTVDSEKAVTVGRSHFRRDAGAARFSLMGSTKPILQIWVNPKDRHGKLAWTFIVRSRSLSDYLRGRDKSVNPHALRYWISAVDGAEVLHRETIVYHVEGIVKGRYWDSSSAPPSAKTEGRLANLYVCDSSVCDEKDPTHTAITNSDGSYKLPGTGSATITARLQGPFVSVQKADDSWVWVLSQQEDGTGFLDFVFEASSATKLAYVTAFYKTNQVRSFLEGSDRLTGSNPQLLQHKLAVLVNADNTCDAYWDGDSIIFVQAGNGCRNSAYIDVIAHEYGHMIDDRIGGDPAKGISGILDPGYSEGFGDALSMLITRQPCVGREFFVDATKYGKCLRDYGDRTPQNIVTWPPETVATRYPEKCLAELPENGSTTDAHCIGEIYGGFVWALIQKLEEIYSKDDAYATAKTLILGAASANPSGIEDAVCKSFLVEAKNNNPTTGFHFQQLAAAADAFGIPRPPTSSCASPGKS